MLFIAENYSKKVHLCLAVVGESLNASLKTDIERTLRFIFGLLFAQLALVLVSLMALIIILHRSLLKVYDAMNIFARIDLENIQSIISNCTLYHSNACMLESTTNKEADKDRNDK